MKVGDIVKLTSSCVEMNVTGFIGDVWVECVWMDSTNNARTFEFKRENLMLVRMYQPEEEYHD